MDVPLEEISAFISQVGFPTFVAIVLLFQVLHMHRENHRQIDRLIHALGQLTREIRRSFHPTRGTHHEP